MLNVREYSFNLRVINKNKKGKKIKINYRSFNENWDFFTFERLYPIDSFMLVIIFSSILFFFYFFVS